MNASAPLATPQASLRASATLGLVHHMLYSRCVGDPDYHEKTLLDFVRRDDMETFDCCLPYGHERQQRLIPAVRDSGKKRITFATHLFPLRKLSFAATAYAEQAQCRMIVQDLVRQAAAIGATGFIFASGGPAHAEGTAAHRQAFLDFCRWLCEELAPHGIDALLEPFDYDFDKKFLFGPLDECLELVDTVRRDWPNIGIELDIAHLPLMREDIASAVHRCGPRLMRVHLGNCVNRDPSDRFYGDNHPPIGYPGGEIDVAETATALRALCEIGYLCPDNRGDLVVELNPFPGLSEDDSVRDNFDRVERAWTLAQESLAGDGAS